ncbi:hypothetical protein DFH07DRAFT_772335 [Mycena maculata]|uniref:Uncharacterized protein n=1 Tax=Mycena maculata TaxID=230809 RepID=A0AAD7NFT3_9AGAR|nr:hypothetical protein DFH07DRAFT_772335 [Mycena maculata]
MIGTVRVITERHSHEARSFVTTAHELRTGVLAPAGRPFKAQGKPPRRSMDNKQDPSLLFTPDDPKTSAADADATPSRQNFHVEPDFSPALSDDLASGPIDFSGINALRTQPLKATNPGNGDVFGGASISQNRKAAISLPQVEAMPEQGSDEEEEDELESPAHSAQPAHALTGIPSPIEFGPGVTHYFGLEQQIGGGRMREATPPNPEDVPPTHFQSAVRSTERASSVTHAAISRRAAAGDAAIASSSLLKVPGHSVRNGPPLLLMDGLGFKRVGIPPPPPRFKPDAPPGAATAAATDTTNDRRAAPQRKRMAASAAGIPSTAIPPRTSSSSNAPPDTSVNAAINSNSSSSYAPPGGAVSAAASVTADPSSTATAAVTAADLADLSNTIPPESPGAPVDPNDEDDLDYEPDGSSTTSEPSGRLRVEQRCQLDRTIQQVFAAVSACATSTGLSDARICAEHRLEEMQRVRGEAAEDDDDLDPEERKVAYHTFLEFHGTNASDILSLHEELAVEVVDQTHVGRSRMLRKVFASGQKMVSRVHQQYGLEGGLMFVGPHLNEDGQLAKCFLTPGLSESTQLPATLHLSHDDFLGAVKLTAYNAENRAVNSLAGRPPIAEGATTNFYIDSVAAAATTASSAATTGAATSSGSVSTATAAAGPPRAVIKKEQTAAKREAAKMRNRSHEENKKAMQALLRNKAKEDVGIDLFVDAKRPGAFVWVPLGSSLKMQNIRLLSFPIDARLPGLSRPAKGAMELTILTHDYSKPPITGPPSAVRMAFTSSAGEAMPCVDGENKMWLASFDLAKSPRPLNGKELSDAAAARLETAAAALSKTDFEPDEYLQDDDDADGEHDMDSEHDTDGEHDVDDDEAEPPKPSAKTRGKKRARTADPEFATDTEVESEDATSPPATRKKSTVKKPAVKKRKSTVPTPPVTRSRTVALEVQEGGGKAKGKKREVREAEKGNGKEKLRVRFAPPAVSAAPADDDDDDDDDDRPLVRAPPPKRQHSKSRRVEDSDTDSGGQRTPPSTHQARCPASKPPEAEISPRHRQPAETAMDSPPQPGDLQILKHFRLDPLVSALVGYPDSPTPTPELLPQKRKCNAPAAPASDTVSALITQPDSPTLELLPQKWKRNDPAAPAFDTHVGSSSKRKRDAPAAPAFNARVGGSTKHRSSASTDSHGTVHAAASTAASGATADATSGPAGAAAMGADADSAPLNDNAIGLFGAMMEMLTTDQLAALMRKAKAKSLGGGSGGA